MILEVNKNNMKLLKVYFFKMAGNSNTPNKVRCVILDFGRILSYILKYNIMLNYHTINIFCIYKSVTCHRYNFFLISFS